MELSPGQIPNTEPLPKTPKVNIKSVWGTPKPVRTYFFQREDGTIITATELSAWGIISGKNQMIGEQRPRPKYIGQNDGQVYYKAMIESQRILKEKGLEEAQEVLRKGLLDAFEDAKKNTRGPRNFNVVDSRGEPINLATYGN